MAAIGAIVSAFSSVISGISAMQQANYQAAIADRNAKVANMNAQHALEVSRIKAEDQDAQSRALKGEQITEQAASGVTLSGDSQVLTRASASRLGRRDALNIVDDGNLEAYNYREQSANFTMQAEASRMSGQASLIGGFLGAVGGIAGGIKSFGSGSGSSVNAPTPVYKPSFITSYTTPLLQPSGGRYQ